MAAPDATLERRPLLWSIAVTAVLGAIGVVWGLWVGSQAIVLDGAYAVVGVLVSWMLLGASRLAATEPGGHYPFGREGVTPLVIGVQGFVLLATLSYAGVEAVRALLEGGSEVDAGWAAAYGVLTAGASLAFWWWIRSQAPGSDLITAESAAWRISALGSVGMVIGFAAIVAAERAGWSDLAEAIDPAMVLVTCVAFAPTPFTMVRTTILELLEGEPGEAVRAPVEAAVAATCAGHGLTDAVVRMSKLGQKLYVEVEVSGPGDLTVREEHAARQELAEGLGRLPHDVWLTFEVLPHRPDTDGPEA